MLNRLVVMMVILQEKVLVEAVSSESDRGDSEAWEGVLESVEPAEAARVAPCLAFGGKWEISFLGYGMKREGGTATDFLSQGS